jgi:hypothetical protein
MREDREAAERTGDGLSLGVSESVARLVEASSSRMGSRLDSDGLSEGFLTNCPAESLGGSFLDCFGIRKVTNGDREVGGWKGKRFEVLTIHYQLCLTGAAR